MGWVTGREFIERVSEVGLSRLALARRLGVDEKVVRRMLDPRHRTPVSRIDDALRALGHELVVESAPTATRGPGDRSAVGVS